MTTSVRTMVGPDGTQWIVRERTFPRAGAGDGWRLPTSPGRVLTFTSRTNERDCARYPDNWRELSDEALWSACRAELERR